MCDKAADNYPYALKFVPGCYMTQKMCDKGVNTYHSTIPFNPDYYKTQEMCDKAVNRPVIAFISILIDIKINKCVTKLFLKIFLY